MTTDFTIQTKYGPYACLIFVLLILFLIWVFWGGSTSEFVGLAPLDPKTCSSYTGSFYDWPQLSSSIQNNISEQSSMSSGGNQLNDQVINQPDKTDEPNNICLAPVKFTPALPITPIVPVINVPPRKKGRFISKGEQICCKTMEEIYGVSFKSIRPDWLSNPETGENLEIDCYNDELKIGVEYNGEQHYKWPNFTNQTYQQFMDQARRDTLKIRLCERKGVYLLIVPYTIPHDQIRNYILERLPETLRKQNFQSSPINDILISVK